MSNKTEQDPEQLDLCTRIRLIEDRQRRQALAMQYLAEAVDRLTDEIRRQGRRYDVTT